MRYPCLEAVRGQLLDAYRMMEECYAGGGKLLVEMCIRDRCLDLAYEKERAEWKDVAVLSLVMAAAGPCKMVYAVMMGLCLLIPCLLYTSRCV